MRGQGIEDEKAENWETTRQNWRLLKWIDYWIAFVLFLFPYHLFGQWAKAVYYHLFFPHIWKISCQLITILNSSTALWLQLCLALTHIIAEAQKLFCRCCEGGRSAQNRELTKLNGYVWDIRLGACSISHNKLPFYLRKLKLSLMGFFPFKFYLKFSLDE